MKKLEDLFCVEEMTPNWKLAISIGKTKVFNDDVIVNHYIKDGVCVINSVSATNSRFQASALKHMILLVKSHSKVVLSFDSGKLQNHLKDTYGLFYIDSKKIYIKGL